MHAEISHPQADTPWNRYHPGADTRQTPPQEQTPPREQTQPLEQTPPRADPPGGRHLPPAQSILGDTVDARAVRIILECNLVVG